MLTVTRYLGFKDSRHFLELRCSCGKTIIKRQDRFESRRYKSCGCKRYKYGHGYFGTPTYLSWCSMIQRCLNKKHVAYKRYGGRGIKVEQRWLESFTNFVSDMGVRPKGRTLDRIDNDGHYEYMNCRWATRRQQALNRRKRSN